MYKIIYLWLTHGSGRFQMLTSEKSKMLTRINTIFLIYTDYRYFNNDAELFIN